MKKVKNVVGAVMYLCSVVLPLIDAIRGIKEGIRGGRIDFKNDLELQRRVRDEEIRRRIQGGTL